MTITTVGDEKQIQQIVKQLDKMIDTVEVRRLDEHKAVYRELILFKIKITKASLTVLPLRSGIMFLFNSLE